MSDGHVRRRVSALDEVNAFKGRLNDASVVEDEVRWQGRPWTPDQIPGIDPEYTWGYPSPYDHKFPVNPDFHNNIQLARGNRLGWADGNFIIPTSDGYQADTGDHIVQTLDENWAIMVWSETDNVTGGGFKKAALVEKIGSDLFLRDLIFLGDAVNGNVAANGYDSRSMIAKLSPSRVVVAFHYKDVAPPSYDVGTPMVYVVERVNTSLNVVVAHHLDAAYEAGQGVGWLPNEGFIGGLVALSPSKWLVSWMGGEQLGSTAAYDVMSNTPRLSVCELNGSTVVDRGHDVATMLGATGVPTAPQLSTFESMGLCALSEDMAAYCLYIDVPSSGLPDAYWLGRLRVVDLDVEFDFPAPFDLWADPAGLLYGYSGVGQQTVPVMIRLDEDRIVLGYERSGNVANRHFLYDNGDCDDLPPGVTRRSETFTSSFWGTKTEPVTVVRAPVMRIVEFSNTVGSPTDLVVKPQHFLDITFPTWRLPDNWGRTGRTTEAYGITSVDILPLVDGQILAMWQEFAWKYTVGSEALGGVDGTHDGFAQRQSVRDRYGLPPEQSRQTSMWMWTVVDLDSTSPSGLHSAGASDTYMFYYGAIHLDAVPCSFGDGNVILCTNEGRSGETAPTHPGYYEHAAEWLKVLMLMNPTYYSDMPPVSVPDSNGNVTINDPESFVFEQQIYFVPPLYKPVPTPGPTYAKELDFFWYAYDIESYKQFGFSYPPEPAPDASNEEWNAYNIIVNAIGGTIPFLDRTVNAYVVGVGDVRGPAVVANRKTKIWAYEG